MSGAKLFEEFPPISSEGWRKKIEADLKGLDFNKKLVWKSEEGFDVQPYYRQEDLSGLPGVKEGPGISPFARNSGRAGNDWLIRQDFVIKGNLAEKNREIIAAISRGAQSLGFNLENIKEYNDSFVRDLLKGIDLKRVRINFLHAADPKKLFRQFMNEAGRSQAGEVCVPGNLGLDPLGKLSSKGKIDDQAFDDVAEILMECNKTLPNFRILTIDAGLFQDGGSTLSQELGFSLAMLNTYLDELTKKGLSPSILAKNIGFSFVSGPNYFMEIAKLRAARWLFSVVCKAWGINETEVPMHIHTRSASWNLTLYDPNVNLLRTTTEAMSGSLGGSDEISVHPYDLVFREGNDFSSRIARNIQVILKEESHFDKVADPASGSYYIENLTAGIAEQAWSHFMEVEERGGYTEAFKSGWIQEAVAASAEKKRSGAASRRQTILGVNQYPNFNEFIMKQELKLPALSRLENTDFTPITPFRIAGELENIRLQTEKSKRRPKVFLLKYGDPVWRTARAIFSGNFFACAGYEIIEDHAYESIEDGIKAAQKVKADIVVLCSSDSEYNVLGAAVSDSLKSDSEIVIAGYPSDAIEELKSRGIIHFIHMKSNLLEELEKFQEIILKKAE